MEGEGDAEERTEDELVEENFFREDEGVGRWPEDAIEKLVEKVNAD